MFFINVLINGPLAEANENSRVRHFNHFNRQTYINDCAALMYNTTELP